MNDQNLTLEQQACNFHTFRHIERVRNLTNKLVVELLRRGELHDQSKLAPPEVGPFTIYTPKLNAMTFNSPEYIESLEGLKASGALTHHYANNRHHPEHFPPRDPDPHLVSDIAHLADCDDLPVSVKERLLGRLRRDLEVDCSSVGRMNIIDVVEGLIDWKAASERHANGNIRTSIEKNAARFGIASQLAAIMENSIDLLT